MIRYGRNPPSSDEIVPFGAGVDDEIYIAPNDLERLRNALLMKYTRLTQQGAADEQEIF